MTFSEPPSHRAGLRLQPCRFAWWLPFMATPLLALHVPSFALRPAQATARPSRPYLAAVDPVSLRFTPPPPEIAVEPRPAAAAPPVPGGPQEEIAATNRNAQLSTAPASETDPAVMPPVDLTSPDEPSAAATTQPAAPVTLLPDDLRREVRPEDVLPLFEPPGGGLILAVPPPASTPPGPALPASSATYRQK